MYTIEKPYVIDSKESANIFLNYFHDFHDGFIKRITLESNDYFSQENKVDIMSRSQTVTEEIMLKLDIAHYNYGSLDVPVNRGICVLFKEFYDVNLVIKRSQKTDWGIHEIKINSISRPLDTDPNFSIKLFDFRWVKPVYDQETGWHYIENSLFKFSEAVAWEEDWEYNQEY